jgi:hypothetical protein
MKRILPILLFFCVIFSLTAQNNNTVKIKFYGGYVLPTDAYKAMGTKSPALGAELNYEILPTGRYSWEKHWGYPTIGVGILGVDVGNPTQLGMMIAAYPYINWNFVRSEFVEFGLKTGMGAAFFNKTNAANGAYIAAYLSAGINLQFNINKSAAFTLDAGYNGTNNGEIFLPNTTMNIIYGSLGFRYRMGSAGYSRPKMSRADNLPYKFMVNAAFDGGFRNEKLGKQPEVQSNIHGDILWKITNCYALGPGVDLGFTPNGIKLGLAVSNAFTIGRVTGILDAGYYLYDKVAIKNNGGYKFWYKFDPNVVDGPLYLRAGLRVRVFDNIFVQVTGKTHLSRFDYIGFGVGYSIPYSTARGSRFGGRTSRYGYGYSNGRPHR